MRTDLLGRRGSGVHHGQKRKLHQQAEYIAADHFSSSELFACNRTADHTLLWGRSPHLKRREADSGKESVCPGGGGVFERGKLNADRKANRKGAALFNGLYLMARESQKPA